MKIYRKSAAVIDNPGPDWFKTGEAGKWFSVSNDLNKPTAINHLEFDRWDIKVVGSTCDKTSITIEEIIRPEDADYWRKYPGAARPDTSKWFRQAFDYVPGKTNTFGMDIGAGRKAPFAETEYTNGQGKTQKTLFKISISGFMKDKHCCQKTFWAK